MRSLPKLRRTALSATLVMMIFSVVCLADTYFENFNTEKAWFAKYWDPEGYVALSESKENTHFLLECPTAVSGPIRSGDTIEIDVTVVRGDGDSAAGVRLKKPDGTVIAFWVDVDGYCFVFSGSPNSKLSRVGNPTHPSVVRSGKGMHHKIKIAIKDQYAEAYVNGTKAANLSMSFAGTTVALQLAAVNWGAMRTEARFDNLRITHAQATPPTPTVSPNLPPKAAFSASPASPKVGDLVRFDASASTDSDGRVVRYAWDFGDGIASAETGTGTILHTYTKAGTFLVKLTVTDDDGSSGSVTRSIIVSTPPSPNVPPNATFSVSPVGSEVGELVRFDASASTDSDGRIVSYAWNYGDSASTAASGSAVSFHAYTRAGTFVVTLTVTDDDGATGSTTRSIVVSAPPPPNTPPTATFSIAPSGPRVGELVRFDASGSTDSDGRITTYAWNYGDSTSSATSGSAVSLHTYTRAGTFVVTLTVTDDDGASNSIRQSITVVEQRLATTAYTVSFLSADPAAWPTKESAQVFVGLRGGEYVLQAKSPGALQVEGEGPIPPPSVAGTRFDIEVTLRSHTSSTYVAGVYFGRSTDDGYYVGIDQSGKVFVFRKSVASVSPVAVTPGEPVAPPGLGTVRLLISVSGSSATIQVNGKTAGTASIPDAAAAATALFLMSQAGPSEVGFSFFAVLTP